MFFYIFSTLFIVIFGLFGGYSKNKEFAAFSRFFVFVWLFFFSAARYGIGTDYPHYEFYYDAIGNGNKIYKFSSPLYYCLNLICNFMQLDFKSFIVICSFLTCFFFFVSTVKKSFIFEVLLFYALIYIQSFCLIRQMLACVIAIYAYKTQKSGFSRSVWLVIAALFHHTFWVVILIDILSRRIKLHLQSVVILSLCAFILFFFTNFISYALRLANTFLPISIGEGYFLLIRRLGLLVLIRYAFVFLFLYSVNIIDRRNWEINLLFLAMFIVEFSGTRMLILASRFPQTFYPAFFLIFTNSNVNKINRSLMKPYSIFKITFLFSIFLAFLILFTQLSTGFHLNNVVPYRWVFFEGW